MVKRPSETCDQIKQTRENFIHELSQNMHLYGISESIGRLYGTVLFADHPMTLDEMSQSLGMSKTSMSTGIRVLMEANMVDKAWQKGVRKDLYQPVDDWYKSFSTVFVKRWKTSVENNLQAVHQMRAALHEIEQVNESEDQDSLDTLAGDLEKLQHAENYYNWLAEVTEIFESGKIFDLIPKK
ncbi:GbsR/MarR family transcriptional regulator [Alkalicoccobacillus murimartini]|uniref:HTH-type transcriptional regulator n=1 Tax=Alkalicoccobacillus murimartini TaxID=171685 RepID=A0ABT9YKQ2_9BACI|nr:GbsR/MarR family transcriptional regulator [Alkalicoccobacillus murimartini]MDQ0208224.1 DNA-binding transcriptional regulator GbsR (MarR family) [Alkalicoccobacillus murimartini]